VPSTALVWFRRDLRVHDHPGLTAAHRACDRVVPVFVAGCVIGEVYPAPVVEHKHERERAMARYGAVRR
jgi:deoxyribodipyrimidine photolyase